MISVRIVSDVGGEICRVNTDVIPGEGEQIWVDRDDGYDTFRVSTVCHIFADNEHSVLVTVVELEEIDEHV